MDEDIAFPLVITVVVILVLCILGYAEYKSEQNCVNHGGHEVITGYSVSSSKYGTTVTPEYSCEGAH
jgi:hypothetical protein